MNTAQFKNISIDKIIEPEWDIRQNTKQDADSDNNDFAGLVQSIKIDGMIHPIIVSKKGTDKYEIVTGRRRFKACKMLGLKEIPVAIELQLYDKNDKQRIALIENLHRKDLSDIEKANGILSIYTNEGYQSHDVIRLIKYLDNNGYQPGTNSDRNRILLLLGNHSLTKKVTNNSKNEPIITEKFLDIVDSIGYSPNTQYKFLQIVVKLQPDILKKAESKGLNMNKKNMLINKKLNEHSIIQKSLIDEIAYKPEKEARVIVAQKIRDIETGALVKTGKDSYTIDFDKREKVDKKIQREKRPIEYYLELIGKFQEVMYLGTGHKLTEDETCYEPNHVDATQKHRFAILHEMDERQIAQLVEDIEIIQDLLDSYLHEIDETVTNNNNKK